MNNGYAGTRAKSTACNKIARNLFYRIMHSFLPSDLLCFSVYATDHAMHRIYRTLLEPLGLTYPQYLVVLALADGQDHSVKSLGAALTLDSGTLTPLLKRMETHGIVTRRRNPADERQTLVQLTEAGRALHGKLGHIPDCILSAAGMTVQEATQLRDMLDKLRHQLNGSAS